MRKTTVDTWSLGEEEDGTTTNLTDDKNGAAGCDVANGGKE
jgi:hypothetical protein